MDAHGSQNLRDFLFHRTVTRWMGHERSSSLTSLRCTGTPTAPSGAHSPSSLTSAVCRHPAPLWAACASPRSLQELFALSLALLSPARHRFPRPVTTDPVSFLTARRFPHAPRTLLYPAIPHSPALRWSFFSRSLPANHSQDGTQTFLLVRQDVDRQSGPNLHTETP